MEVMPPPPPQDFLLDSTYQESSAATSNPFASADDTAAPGNPFLATAATAPPSPNPFEHLPPGSASDADDPFDPFQHFTSAPASPARAAALYAQLDANNAAADGFQPRVSYSTATSTVPFEWEERPGKPKPGFAAAANAEDDPDPDDFDFGVLLDKAALPVPELTTADELFNDGKIRPLKPPPRLHEGGGSVGSSPRSARSMIWSPRLRGTRGRSAVGPGGGDFDPFAAALEKAAMAPSPLGIGSSNDDAAGGVSEPAASSSPTNTADPAASAAASDPPPPGKSNGGRKKWRLSDLLLFRRASSAKGRNISRDPVFKYTPVKDANAEPGAANGDAAPVKHKQKQSKKAAPASAAAEGEQKQSVMGCVRLHPGLHRLAKGFNGHSVHLGGRGNAKPATKG